MKRILGSLALLAALCLPAAAAETVLCRVSGYPAPTTCSTQPALLGSSLPVAPGTATAGVASFAARADLLALQGACSLGANVTSNGTGALRAAGSGDAVLGYAIAEGDTDVSVQVFIQG